MTDVGTQDHQPPLGVRTSGWAAFALICLLVQKERGPLFWLIGAACCAWLGVGLYILAAEIKADAREARERLRRSAAPRAR